MNPAFALSALASPAHSIRYGIPVEAVQRTRLSDDFVAGWNAAANHFQTPPAPALPRPVNVIFNGPATVVYWDDGTKTVVKCQPGDTFSAETGLMAAMLKRYMGNDNTYNKVINYWLDKLVSHLPQLPAATE